MRIEQAILKLAVLLTGCLVSFGTAPASILNVPSEYTTIQLAIDNCLEGDTVLVAQGRYAENLNFSLGSVTLASHYLISGDSAAVSATSLVSPSATVLLNAVSESEVGLLSCVGLRFVGNTHLARAIQSNGQNFVLSHCSFDSFHVVQGPIVSAVNCRASVQETSFDNSIAEGGTFVAMQSCTASFWRCAFRNNPEFAQLFLLRESDLQVTECIFAGNGLSAHGLWSKAEQRASIKISICDIRRNTLQSLLTVSPQGQQIVFECLQTTIDSNTFVFDMLNLNGWAAPSSVTFNDNFVGHTTVLEGFGGLHLLGLASHDAMTGTVQRNIFYRNHRRQVPGVFYDEFGQFLVSRNYFIENTTDGFLSSPGGPVMLIGNNVNTFYENILLNNEGNGVDHFGFDDPGHAEHNYWGHASGPYNAWSNPEGLGDTVDTLIFYEPWEADTLFLSSPDNPDVPVSFALGYPYPNPFNSSVTIEYALTHEQEVKFEIYDVLGRQVKRLLNERKGIGVHTVRWSADGFPSGLYFARLSSENGEARAVKLMLLK